MKDIERAARPEINRPEYRRESGSGSSNDDLHDNQNHDSHEYPECRPEKNLAASPEHDAPGRCLICGAPLPPLRGKYCSEACMLEANRILHRERKAARKIDDIRICPVCGAPVPPGRRADKIYCSMACRKVAKRGRDREAWQREKISLAAAASRRKPDTQASIAASPGHGGQGQCLVCGAPLPPGRGKYCSLHCKDVALRRARKKRKAGLEAGPEAGRKCRICGKPLPPGCHANRIYCSNACRIAAISAQNKARYSARYSARHRQQEKAE